MVGLGYSPTQSQGYIHRVTFLKGKKASASELMPRVHRIASLLQTLAFWGTHQGAVKLTNILEVSPR